ncbi:aldose epimerase family protein [Vagococcus xieshaowenii]|uniref:Galactose mutarotase n=1 Tax=Vagococcus xieshaowenii TaxID=2562451 RepID=A0AAJ5JLH7_9ENTE|nr:aldose epimerase family protein [Vagococcus xieshaowenii]QCA28115.1 galactose mutarotase [Vagococcus xieshaowenii]TFZ40158.1 galactose mutarotase [Vagococcus xieshaowenii]
MRIKEQKDGKLNVITLENGVITASFVNYGARMHTLYAPDKKGKKENVLLSFDSLEALQADTSFFGATVGPVAGRIRQARWGELCLDKNNGDHHIHGGDNGWSYRYWETQVEDEGEILSVIFTLHDDSSGYPGPIDARVVYRLIGNCLEMEITGSSERLTLFNPTSHTYFNLSGDGKRDLDSHILQVQSHQQLILDEDKLPTGESILPKLDVAYPQDFNDIFQVYPQGLDDYFVFDKKNEATEQLVLSEKISGRQLEIVTERQGVVLFSTTGFDADIQLNGRKMHSNYGLAIEPQEAPDSVHFDGWPSIELSANEEKKLTTRYYFN